MTFDRRQRAENWRAKNDKDSPVESLTMTPDAAKEKFLLSAKQQEVVDKAKESGDNVCVYWIPFANKEKRVTDIVVEKRDAVKAIEGKEGTDAQHGGKAKYEKPRKTS